ncbi:MAG: ABC transporter ATP-binding protein [Planctomycetota bacterium]|jgi:putative ABC transport system ATP-binding protein
MSSPPVFEARAATRTFVTRGGRQVHAVDELSLLVERGAFLTVTGPSGCGKTTLLTLLGALDRPTGGAVLFDGRDIGAASESERARVRRRLGLVFQHAPMIRGLPLWENITYPLVPRGVRGSERSTVAARLLERVGLGGRGSSLPEELSGGERQRAGLARALCAEPEALLADEPTSNLDRETGAGIVALLRELHAAGKTIVVATHDTDLAALATSTLGLT